MEAGGPTQAMRRACLPSCPEETQGNRRQQPAMGVPVWMWPCSGFAAGLSAMWELDAPGEASSQPHRRPRASPGPAA